VHKFVRDVDDTHQSLQKVFEQHMQNYTPADPLYEEYTDEQGRKKRRKVCHRRLSGQLLTNLLDPQRELPPGLSKRDAAILKKVKKRAHYLDKGFSVCGLRFGWTFVIGSCRIVFHPGTPLTVV
jgi:hypothetical protein